jgi:HSP20 family protein
MDDLWSRFFDTSWTHGAGREGVSFVPQVDIKETEQALEMTVEVPGLKAEEIEVTLIGDTVTIKGEKKEEREEKKDNYHLVERRFGSFQRSFRLPVPVDQAKLTATHKDGVLKMVMPKAQSAEVKKIEIKAE